MARFLGSVAPSRHGEDTLRPQVHRPLRALPLYTVVGCGCCRRVGELGESPGYPGYRSCVNAPTRVTGPRRKELGAYGARGTEGWTRVNEKWNGDYR